MKTKKIQKALQTLVEFGTLSDGVVTYVEPNEFGDGYWDYHTSSGWGFSSPNTHDFIVDVLYEVTSDIEMVNNNPNAFGFSEVSPGWNTKRKITKKVSK
jgi:hypothetical protein